MENNPEKRTVKFKLNRKFGISDNSRNLSSGKKKPFVKSAEKSDREISESKPFSREKTFGERKSFSQDRPRRSFDRNESRSDSKPFSPSDRKKSYGERDFSSDRPRRRSFDQNSRKFEGQKEFKNDRFSGERKRSSSSSFERTLHNPFHRKPIELPPKEISEEIVRDEEVILAALEAHENSEQSFNPPWFKRLLLLTTEKGREREGKFLAEGIRVVQEMLEYHNDLLLDIYTVPGFKDQAFIEKAKVKSARLHEISEEQMKEISSTVTHQGVIAVCRTASVKPDYEKSFSVVTLVDAVQDPGNLGTLFRTSLGFNTSGLVLGKGSVNPFNPKVVRGSSGTFLRVPFEVDTDLTERINFLHQKGYTVIATDLHGKQELKDIAPRKLKKVAILVGNEGAGANPHFIDMADEVVRIPMSSTLESLNVSVAHGILSYEIALLQKELF